MNANKEAEYMAEIVRLNGELKKSQMFINKEMLSSNKDMLRLANQCIEQISRNVKGNLVVDLHSHASQRIDEEFETTRYSLTEKVVSTSRL